MTIRFRNSLIVFGVAGAFALVGVGAGEASGGRHCAKGHEAKGCRLPRDFAYVAGASGHDYYDLNEDPGIDGVNGFNLQFSAVPCTNRTASQPVSGALSVAFSKNAYVGKTYRASTPKARNNNQMDTVTAKFTSASRAKVTVKFSEYQFTSAGRSLGCSGAQTVTLKRAKRNPTGA
jgi:hypothetical protein